MKNYINILIKDKSLTPVDIKDAIITNPNDELFDLQEKYGVKISRSNSSDAVYIFKSRSRKILRVGHPINKKQKHLWNFDYNESVRGDVTKEIVEESINKYLNRL